MAGASAVVTQAQQRLNRLLDAVARQEPKLRWAIGDRDDVTTVLATDLASGWIPPHPATPADIGNLLSSLADLYQNILLTQLAEGNRTDLDALYASADDSVPKMTQACK
ncbi:DUF5632 domain-containing protein [Mycolicibacterium aichiense]|uniref:DUF5632 domain-containing protein n=1 Tax=Mycolicibacterium aichiense TaxID=1799 RepID=UPI003D66E599